MSTDSESAITVSRPRGLTDRLRSYRILIDGEEAVRIRSDTSVTIPVAPGHPDIEARIDWHSSPKLSVDVRPGETVALDCAGQRSMLVALARLFVRRHEYLSLAVRPAASRRSGAS